MITLPEIRALAFGLIAVALAACSASEPSNYYLLSSLPVSEAPVRSASTDQLAVGIGPVSLPAYLDRPQLVTRASANRLNLSEFDRWAEPLQDMFSQTLSENISVLIGSDLVYVLPRRRIPEMNYVVVVEVLKFDRGVGGEAELLARWTVLTGDEAETLAVRKSSITERVSQGGPEETIVAMSRAVETLSREIARDLRGRAERTTVSGYDLRRIQNTLTSLGYDPGRADGLMGPKTREAIRRFQADQGIRVTGEPSGQLQYMLMAMP